MNENQNHGIINVLGRDSVGIIARVCTFLSESGVNILDISQTIVGGFFSMLMIVDLGTSSLSFDAIQSGLVKVGESLGVEVRLQRESIFDAMHRI